MAAILWNSRTVYSSKFYVFALENHPSYFNTRETINPRFWTATFRIFYNIIFSSNNQQVEMIFRWEDVNFIKIGKHS